MHPLRLCRMVCLAALFLGIAPHATVLMAGETSQSSGDEVRAALKDLQARTAHIKYIRSQFSQSKYLSFMSETLHSQGFFVFQAPANLLWQYTSPVSSGLRLQDGVANIWSGEEGRPGAAAGRLESAAAKAIAGQVLAWTALDAEALLRGYRIVLLAKNPLRFDLTPLTELPGNPVAHFEVAFAPDNTKVREVVLYEAGGDHTRLEFYDTQQSE